ncbi:MAG TPA: serine--tRNA ligase, partial [Thermotoga sp.]|nr:serine--tRNA ligase [Thermotoga sp.]
MLDIKIIREDPEKVKDALKKRGYSVEIIDNILEKDKIWRKLIAKENEFRFKRNEISKAIAKLKKEGREEDVKKLIEEGKTISQEVEKLENEKKEIESHLKSLLLQVPNIPHSSVPVGEDESG